MFENVSDFYGCKKIMAKKIRKITVSSWKNWKKITVKSRRSIFIVIYCLQSY